MTSASLLSYGNNSQAEYTIAKYRGGEQDAPNHFSYRFDLDQEYWCTHMIQMIRIIWAFINSVLKDAYSVGKSATKIECSAL